MQIVEQDAEAQRFLPKVVRTALALSSHHIVRSRRMTPPLRREMRDGIRDLLTTLPTGDVAHALDQLEGSKRRVLARTLRMAGHAT